MKRTRILVSGFEPFDGDSLNPSSLAVKALYGNPPSAGELVGIEVSGVILPVVFGEAFLRLRDEIKLMEPDVVVALGQAAGRHSLCVERVAINVMDAEFPDNSGYRPRNRPILEGGAAAHFATLPVHKMVEAARAAGVKAEVSNSAGTYVCNELMYRLLDELRFTTRRAGFIHLPLLPERSQKHAGAPTMELADMVRGLTAMLAVCDDAPT